MFIIDFYLTIIDVCWQLLRCSFLSNILWKIEKVCANLYIELLFKPCAKPRKERSVYEKTVFNDHHGGNVACFFLLRRAAVSA